VDRKTSRIYELMLLLAAIYFAVVIGLLIKKMADRCALGYCEIRPRLTEQPPDK